MENRSETLMQSQTPKPISTRLVYLVAISAACLCIANVLANNMLQVGNWTTSAGILTFPISYILASIIAEIYGYKWARRTAWISLALSGLMALLIQLSLVLPQPEWYDRDIFAAAVGGTWRIVIASLVAFTFGRWLNDILFHYFKKKHKDMKGFTFRALASSIGGHIVDTTIFTLIAFAGVVPNEVLLGMVFIGVTLKWGYEWLTMPLTVWVTKWILRKETEEKAL